jgi:methyl coenzyme M reductase gamma subunit
MNLHSIVNEIIEIIKRNPFEIREMGDCKEIVHILRFDEVMYEVRKFPQEDKTIYIVFLKKELIDKLNHYNRIFQPLYNARMYKRTLVYRTESVTFFVSGLKYGLPIYIYHSIVDQIPLSNNMPNFIRKRSFSF